MYRHLPWFDYTISSPMYANELRFESDQHIAEFRQPVLILHAEDDHVVPFNLGYKVSSISELECARAFTIWINLKIMRCYNETNASPIFPFLQLYRTALDTRGKSWGPIEFHRFEKTSHYGHRYICRAPNLPEIVIHFFRTYRNEQY